MYLRSTHHYPGAMCCTVPAGISWISWISFSSLDLPCFDHLIFGLSLFQFITLHSTTLLVYSLLYRKNMS